MLFRIIGSTKSRNSETGLELRSSHHAFDAAVLASDRFHGVHQPRQQTLSAALDPRPSLLSFRCRPKENPSGHTFNFFNNRAPGRGCWPGLRKPLGFTWMLPFFACFSACGSVFPSQALMAIAPCAKGSRTASGIMLGRALAAAIAWSATTASGRSSLLGLWPLDSALRSRNKACCLNGRRSMGLVNLGVAATRHSDGRLMFTSLHGGPMGQQLLISPPRVACEAQCFPPPLRVVGLQPPTTKGESEPIRTRSSTATAKASSSCLLWLKLAVVGGAHRFCHLEKTWGVAWSLHRAHGVPGRWAAASSLVCGLAARKRTSRAPALAPSRRRLLLRSALVGWPCQRPRLGPASAWVSDAFFV